MKRVILLCCSILSIASIKAQDIIIMHDASQVEARVEVVGPEQIQYRKYDNLEGPLYTVGRSDVFIIRYENGTREVITPLEGTTGTASEQTAKNTAAADDSKYAHITAASKRVAEDLHKKKFYFTAQVNFGYSVCYEDDYSYSADGLSTGFDLLGEFFPSKKSSSGAVVGLGYNYKRYSLSVIDPHINLDAFDINLGYSYRSDISKFFGRLMLNINVPLSSAIPGYYFTNNRSIDMMDITNTTVGFIWDVGVHFGNFNVGGRIGTYFNGPFEDCPPALIVGVLVGYTF